MNGYKSFSLLKVLTLDTVIGDVKKAFYLDVEGIGDTAVDGLVLSPSYSLYVGERLLL